jgi:hypothetical protein
LAQGSGPRGTYSLGEKSARVLRYLVPLRRWSDARFAALSLELKSVVPTMFLLGGEAERDVSFPGPAFSFNSAGWMLMTGAGPGR